jgi:hypothetical protein
MAGWNALYVYFKSMSITIFKDILAGNNEIYKKRRTTRNSFRFNGHD